MAQKQIAEIHQKLGPCRARRHVKPHVEIDGKYHISRYCKPSSIDPDGQPYASAFELREDRDEYLSVNWLEYFETHEMGQAIDCVRQAFLSKGFSIKTNGRFALLRVGEVVELISGLSSNSSRIKYLPVKDDPSHCGVFGYTALDEEIALEIARLVRVENMYLAKVS